MDQVVLGTNGLACLTTGGQDRLDCAEFTPEPLPSANAPNDMVACHWEDLDLRTRGSVTYGTTQIDGASVFVARYDETHHFGNASTNVTFQLQLYETGVVTCQFANVTADGDDEFTSIGLQSEASTGVQYAHENVTFVGQGVTFAPVLAPPSDLTVEPPSSTLNTLDLSWTAPSSPGPVEAYRIYRGPDESSIGADPVATVPGDHTTYRDQGLDDNETYAYKVSAVLGIEGEATAPVTGWTLGTPSEPRGLVADPVEGTSEIDLSWNVPDRTGGPAFDIARYEIRRNGGFLSEISADVTAFTDSFGLQCHTDYTYRIRAQNDGHDGWSTPSEPVTVQLAEVCPTEVRDLEARGGVREVQLAWQPPTESGTIDITEYNVFRSTVDQDDKASLIATVDVSDVCDATGCTYNDPHRENATTYYYHVTAVNADGHEGPDITLVERVEATTYGPPTGVEAAVEDATAERHAININWTSPETDGDLPVHGFVIYRRAIENAPPANASQEPHENDTLAQVDGQTLTYTDIPDRSGTYCYQVAALNTTANATPASSIQEGDQARMCAQAGNTTDGHRTIDELPGIIEEETQEIERRAKENVSALSEQANQTLDSTNDAVNQTRDQVIATVTEAVTNLSPSRPQNLVATAGPDAGEVNLTWEAPDRNGTIPVLEAQVPLVGYDVYAANDPEGPFEKLTLSPVTTTSFIDTGRDDGETVYYRVNVTNALGLANRSEVASATTFDVPTPPLGVTVTTGSEPGTLEVSWNPPADANTGGDGDPALTIEEYVVYRRDPGDATFSEVATVSTTSFTDDDGGDGLVEDHYTYYVTAENDKVNGESAPSETAFGLPENVAPDAPENLVCESGPAGEIDCDWDKLDGYTVTGGSPIAEYVVYRTTSPVSDPANCPSTATWEEVARVTTDAYTDVGLAPGVPYCYQVTAINEGGYEGPVSEADGAAAG